jgi:Vitamin-D-receptor interacting Mediator subunit 4
LEKKLDDQIKATVQLLADTRRELKAAKFTEFPSDTRPVPFDELLRFAKNISKFTVPPTAALSQQPTVTNGAAITAADEGGMTAGSPATRPVKVEISTTQPTPAATQDVTMTGVEDVYRAGDAGVAWQTLTDQHKAWLDHFAQAPFVPWPNEENIKAGALSGIQTLIEQGKDPEKSGALAIDSGKRPTPIDVSMEDDAENGERSRIVGPPSAIEKPKAPKTVFEGFDF